MIPGDDAIPCEYEDGEDLLSAGEAAAILRGLRDTGCPELADRVAPILERVTRTDRPPPPAADE